MTTIDIKKLSPEQKAELAAQLQADKAAEKEQRKQNLEALEKMAADVMPEAFSQVETAAQVLAEAKANIFRIFQEYLKLKIEVFENKSLQKTHTITVGDKSITLGYRVTDGYSDNANYGIAMVHKFLGTLAKDENSKKLLQTVYRLLSKNAKGDLDSKKVLELAKIAQESYPGTEFEEGIGIIQDAFSPKMSKWFIEAKKVDGQGVERSVPLSITSADLPDDFDLSFLLPKTDDNE
jgi:hypothetical protein